jgi:hypothetical protein
MVFSKPSEQSTAPSGWQALAGLTVSASRWKFSSLYSSVVVHWNTSSILSCGCFSSKPSRLRASMSLYSSSRNSG